MSRADDTRLPGLDRTASAKIWDRIQSAIDAVHDELLSDASMARFDRNAVIRECEFAAMGWAVEASKAEPAPTPPVTRRKRKAGRR